METCQHSAGYLDAYIKWWCEKNLLMVKGNKADIPNKKNEKDKNQGEIIDYHGPMALKILKYTTKTSLDVKWFITSLLLF
jgi:hypothetical protein